mmetsp:Transcript_22094/g.46521  ORF Transcript_22094/g.46521 Transcript_22094/m.46521 type:complete len:85 (-) Transcript_22094:2-256(-)
MLSGQPTVTECIRTTLGNAVRRFQIGEGNTARNQPKIISGDRKASNGVMHIVDEVILQKFGVPELLPIVKPPIISTMDPTETPK